MQVGASWTHRWIPLGYKHVCMGVTFVMLLFFVVVMSVLVVVLVMRRNLPDLTCFFFCLHDQRVLALAMAVSENSDANDEKAHEHEEPHRRQHKRPMRNVV